jgi:hypothetical protein
MQDDAPIRLYWWNARPNFGDALSELVTSYASGRRVEWAAQRQADLFAVGSLMRMANSVGVGRRPPMDPLVIWGTGAMEDIRFDLLAERAHVAAVRGPLTAAVLGLESAVLGDPGLLAQEATGFAASGDIAIGVIPHFKTVPAVRSVLEDAVNKDLVIIDPCDPLDMVLRQISACRLIVSSSLHGLVVADSFGIPSVWMEPGAIHPAPHFKFEDYAAGIGRTLNAPIALASLPGFVLAPELPDTRHFERLGAVKQGLVDAFPSGLSRRRPDGAPAAQPVREGHELDRGKATKQGEPADQR